MDLKISRKAGNKTITKDMDSDVVFSKNLVTQINHNLKTPLTPIKVYADMLLLEKFGTLNKIQKEKLSHISTNIAKLEQSVEKFF